MLALVGETKAEGCRVKALERHKRGGNSKLMLLVASSAGKRASGTTAPISNPKPKGLLVFIGVPLLLKFRMLTARMENSVRHKIYYIK